MLELGRQEADGCADDDGGEGGGGEDVGDRRALAVIDGLQVSVRVRLRVRVRVRVRKGRG